MSKYRSSEDFAAMYASNKQGIATAIENYVHLKSETTPGTFVTPSIGTQGSSTSDSSPSTDISGGSDTNLRINVDGAGVVAVTLATAGKTSGALIAAELESKINTALSTAGYDARVWVEFTGGLYVVHSQKVGTTSAVVITNGASANVADDLKLGVANSGTEAVGTWGGDFLLITKASLKVEQPFEKSEHRSGRQTTNIIKKKKVAEGELELYLNVGTGGSPTIDTPLSTVLAGLLGKRTDTGSTEIKFDASQTPAGYYSIVQGNNAFNRCFNGVYGKSLSIKLPGDGEAKLTIPVKARDGIYAGIAQVNGAVSASTTVIVNNTESKRFDTNARVMVIDPDGRTIVAGADGSLYVASRTDGSHILTMSAAVTVSDDGFVVPWLPHTLDQHATDNPVTGLQGTVSFDGGATTVEEIRNVEFTFDPKVEDQDNWFGFDTNKGFVVGDKADIMVKIEMLVSASQLSRIVQSREFATAAVQVTLGSASGRRYRFDCPQVYFKVPPVEIGANGSVVMSLEGIATQTAAGQLDAFAMRLL